MDGPYITELQPVRRAPPPPRLNPPATGRSNSCRSTKSQAPKPQPQATYKLQHSASMPIFDSDCAAPKKKAPPPRPPPPKINSKTQRLGSRKHENLTSGGEGITLTGPPRSSSSSSGRRYKNISSNGSNGPHGNSNDALLIDFSPPPRSPSLAASGSDDVSVNSFGSESSGNFFDAPSSWSSARANGSGSAGGGSVNGGGLPSNFDPFGSIEEESKKPEQFNVGQSSFYNSSMQSSSSSGRQSNTGPCYDSSLFKSPNGAADIDWGNLAVLSGRNNSNQSSVMSPDPFSPIRASNIQDGTGSQSAMCHQQESFNHQGNSASTFYSSNCVTNNGAPSKVRSGLRATIIRPKQSAEDHSSSSISQQQPQSNSALLASLQHSSSSPTSGSSNGCISHSLLNKTLDIMDAPIRGLDATNTAPDTAPTPATTHQVNNSRTEGTYAVAEYDYDSAEPGDLCLKVGDRVELVAAITDDWLEGRLHGRQGLFPTAFVRILHPPNYEEHAALAPPVVAVPDATTAAAALSHQQATALYSFTAEQATDLTLQEGDVVTVTGMVEGGQWLLGHCYGRSGQFPANFVSHVPSNLPVVTL